MPEKAIRESRTVAYSVVVMQVGGRRRVGHISATERGSSVSSLTRPLPLAVMTYASKYHTGPVVELITDEGFSITNIVEPSI